MTSPKSPKKAQRSAKSLKPVVPIQLDRERRLKYDFSALCVLEEKFNINLFDGKTLNEMSSAISPPLLSKLIYAGLLHETPDVTLDEVRDAMQLSQLSQYIEQFTEAIERAMQ